MSVLIPLTDAFAFLLRTYGLRDPEFVWTRLESGLVVRREVSRYLFRGECGDFPTTIASVHRHETYNVKVDGRSVQAPIAELLPLVEKLVWRFGNADYGLNGRLAQGLFQHYGLPTAFLDFSKRPDCAVAFAAKKPSPVARIAVIPSSPDPVIRLVDLTDHPWAVRPQRQAAVGINLDASFRDLKSQEVRARLGIKWYQFPVTAGDVKFCTEIYKTLVRSSDDPSAGLLRFLITEYVEAFGKLSPALACWLVEHIPIAPHCYSVKAFEGSEVVVNYRDQHRAGLSHFDEATERTRSEQYWSSAHADSRSWDRMKNWKWPNVGEIIADPRTYHPVP